MKDLAPERPFQTGEHEDDALWLAQQWAGVFRRDPPPSGDFLADDLDYIISEIESLRRVRDGLVEILRLVNPYVKD